MLRPFRVAWLFLRIGVMNEVQYRANFFVALFRSLLALAVGLIVLALVFSNTTTLKGWDHSELLCVMGIQIAMGGVIRATIQPNMLRLIEEVGDGKLDYMLTKPEDSQVLVSVREVRIWSLIDVVTGGIVVGIGASRLDSGIGLGDTLAFVALLVVGGAMLYCVWLVLATDRHLSGLAALFDDVPRADRVRDHGARAGDHVTVALDDGRNGARVRRGAVRLHALVLALRAAALLRRIGLISG